MKREKGCAYQSAVPDGIPSLGRFLNRVHAKRRRKIPAGCECKDTIAKTALCQDIRFADASAERLFYKAKPNERPNESGADSMGPDRNGIVLGLQHGSRMLVSLPTRKLITGTLP
jgi:hypothetical protein